MSDRSARPGDERAHALPAQGQEAEARKLRVQEPLGPVANGHDADGVEAGAESPDAEATDAAHGDLLTEIQRLIAELEAHPDAAVGERVRALLAGIDTVHRVPLARLVEAVQQMAGEAFLNRLVADQAIRLLLMSYDLVAVDRRLLAEEALDLVRDHLRSHAIDLELLEVVGGVVYVRLHGEGIARVSEAAIRRDLETALAEGLLGFQELVIGERERTSAPPAFVPADSLRRARRPVYQAAGRADALEAGQMRAVTVAGESVLLANVDGDIVAVRNQCGSSPLPLHFGQLHGAELTCSWHGCRYDLRTGRRLDRDDVAREEWLTVLPVAVRDGVVQVAMATTAGSAAGDGAAA